MSDQIKYVEGALSSKEKKKINDAFSQYQIDFIPTDENPQPFCFKAYDNNVLIGSIEGNTFLGALRISNLLIVDKYRGQGIAKSLIKQAEEHGIKMGCRLATLSTFNYQAPEFYKKLGYNVDFEQAGYAHDTVKISLSKALDK